MSNTKFVNTLFKAITYDEYMKISYFSKCQKTTKNVFNIFISHISRPGKMIKSWSFFQKMRREKLYKKCTHQSYWLALVAFSLLNMNNLHGSATSRRNKNVWKSFLFCDHTACIKLSTMHLSKTKSRCYHFLKSRYSQNKKVFQTFLFCREVALPCRLFILSKGKATRETQ